MSKYKLGDKFVVISSNMNNVKIGNVLEYEKDHSDPNLFYASGWIINYDLTVKGFPQTKLQLLEETKMNEINIEVPEGFIIDKENSSFTCIKFKKVEKKEVTCWEDLGEISGYYLGADSKPVTITDYPPNLLAKQVFATKEQAEACIALAMLSQLMKNVNGDWIPDWNDQFTKYVLEFYTDFLEQECYSSTQHFLAFPTEEIRDTFLKNHKELIMKAKPLL